MPLPQELTLCAKVLYLPTGNRFFLKPMLEEKPNAIVHCCYDCSFGCRT